MHYLNYADDGTRIPPVQAEPVEAKEPWKPKKGEKMYAIVEFDGISASGDAHILVQYDDDHRELTSCGISQLRPLPVVQGEGVVK